MAEVTLVPDHTWGGRETMTPAAAYTFTALPEVRWPKLHLSEKGGEEKATTPKNTKWEKLKQLK